MAKSSIFISYARADDEPFVKRLHEALTSEGYSVWWDREKMQARGVTFLQEIRDAITNVDRVILVVGPEIHKSAYVKAEWEYALSICKVVNPILRLGDYPLVPDALKNVHTVDCRETRAFEAAFGEIKRVIDVPSGELGTLHAVPLLPQWYIRREEDLRDVIALVCADTTGPVVVTSKKQTVTLQGTGGIGKTTLAAAIAQDCDVRRVFPDGVFWLEIGKEPTLTLRQGDIGVAFKDSRDEYPDTVRGKSRLSAILQDKQTLLILDDVWDRQHAEAFRVSAPRCRLLITTRQAGLITQLGAVNHGLDMLTDEEGVALIETRLEIIEKENPYREDQRQMVHLLGGHTLAVSIAAAQLSERGADFAPKLLERLQKRQGGDSPFKDLVMEESDRQYNLEATLSLSYEALSDDYKRRFRALGVFAAEGSFDVAAVGAVWGDDADNTDAAEDALHALWRGALISREGEGRYSQHSLLRTYALALSQRAGEVETYRSQHFAHYEALHGHYNGYDNEESHPLIRRDLENIQQALAWGAEAEPERLVNMTLSLNYFFELQNLHELNRQFITVANHAAIQIGYQKGQAITFQALGRSYVHFDELQQARNYYDNALSLFERINDRLGQANTLKEIGDLSNRLDEREAARRFYDRALIIYEQLDDKLGQANTSQALGDLFVHLDELEQAGKLYERALALYEQLGTRLGQANVLGAMGVLCARLQKLQAAHHYSNRALSMFTQIDDRLGQANTLKLLGDIVVRLDELDPAREHYKRALSIYEQIKSRLGEANTLRALGELAMRFGELPPARDYYIRALHIYEQIEARLGQANTLQALGEVCTRLDEIEQSRAYYNQALSIYEQIGARLGQAGSCKALGDLLTKLGELDRAREYYDQALTLYKQIGERVGQAFTLQALGELYEQLDDPETARSTYRDALELFESLQVRVGMINVLSIMAEMEAEQGNRYLACDYYGQLFAIVDVTSAYANHPAVQLWRKQYQELCGGSSS